MNCPWAYLHYLMSLFIMVGLGVETRILHTLGLCP